MTSNRAWMPLHIEKYLADTGHLTAAEHGAYMLLIMAYWRDGGLPADERLIQRMSRLSKDEWAESRDILAALFQDGWTHKRIDAELAKADDIIEKRRSAADARHKRSKQDAYAVQVQSKSTDTGALPITNNPSSSLRLEDAPLPPKGEGAVDLFDQVEEVFPRSPHYNQAKAERHWRKLTQADQRSLASKAQSFSKWWKAEQERRGRSMADSLAFAPPLDKWIGEGAWRSFEPAQLSQAVELPVLRQGDPLIPHIERIRGRPIIFGTKGTTTVTPAELEQAKAHDMGQAGAA